MARKPNYQFERLERERQKAAKTALKAEAKREERERARAARTGEVASESPDSGSGSEQD